jgi:hypothetical protein
MIDVLSLQIKFQVNVMVVPGLIALYKFILVTSGYQMITVD